MATLNEIPLSFLQHHSYILHVAKRSNYRYNYGSPELFPSDFDGTIGDFLDSDIKNDYMPLYTKICKEGVDQEREFKIKDFIIELYDVTRSHSPFKQFRLYSLMQDRTRPEVYKTSDFDTLTLEEVFEKVDENTRAIMGLSLVVNDQYRECLGLDVFNKVREEDDFLTQLRRFIDCYKIYKQALPVKRNNDNQGEVFARIYQYKQYDSTAPTRNDLALEFKLTNEGITAKVKSLLKECRLMIFDRGLDFLLPDSFYKRINDLTSFVASKNLITKQQLISQIGLQIDEKALTFIVDLYKMQELDLDVFGICYSTKVVGVQDIKKSASSLWDYFSKNPLGLTKNLVDKDCLKKASGNVKAGISDLMDASPCFIKESDGDETLYFIKWQYIKNISERIARILYEEENHQLELAEIVRIYNDRAKRSNVNIDQITTNSVTSNDHIQCIGKTGLWKLVDASASMNNDVRGAETLLKEFLSSQEKDNEFDFNDFKAYLLARNIDNYSDKSLGATICTLGYKKKVRGGSVYVLNNIKRWSVRELVESAAQLLAESSGKCLTKTDIRNTLQEKYSKPVNYGTLTNALEQAVDLFEIQPAGRSVRVILLNERLSEVDFSRYDKVHKHPPYQTAIIQTAIDELLRSKDHSMLMSDLKDIVDKYIPSDIHDNIVYKIFEREEIFKKSDTKPKVISLDLKLYKEQYANQMSLYDANESDTTEVAKVQPDGDLEFGFDWSVLKEMIISHNSLAFDVKSHADKLTVLDRMYAIMRGSESDVFSDSQFWKILDMWYRLYRYPTSCYERELLGTKLVLGLENYLQNLLIMYGTSAADEGLIGKINVCQAVGSLPSREQQGHKINRMIGNLAAIRNRYSHENNEKFHGDAHVYNTIDKFMRFYIMVAEYNCRLG